MGISRRWRHSRHNFTKTQQERRLTRPSGFDVTTYKVEEHKDRLLEVTERGNNCRSRVIAASYVESAGARYRKCIVRSPSASQSRRNDQNAIGPHSSIRLAELDASNDVLDAAVHGGSLIFISSRANDQSASGKALAVDLEE